jgi:hypothetical protein
LVYLQTWYATVLDSRIAVPAVKGNDGREAGFFRLAP